MKKITLMVTALMSLASLAHAVSFSWNTNGSTISSSATVSSNMSEFASSSDSTYTIAFVSSTAGNVEQIKSDIVANATSNTLDTYLSSNVVDTGTVSFGNVSQADILSGNFNFSGDFATDGSFYIVIINADGSQAIISSKAVTYTGKPGNGFDILTDPDTGVTGPGSNNPWQGDFESAGAVPEPTALALLLLGVSAAALRRKVRA